MKSLIILSILTLSCLASGSNIWNVTIKDAKGKTTKLEYSEAGKYELPLLKIPTTKCNFIVEEPLLETDSKDKSKKEKLQLASVSCYSGATTFTSNLMCAVPPTEIDRSNISAISIVEGNYNHISFRCRAK